MQYSVCVCVFMQETRIRVEKDHQRTGCKLNLINPGHGDSVSHVFITETPDILQEWLDALWQHIYDQGQFNQRLSEFKAKLFYYSLYALTIITNLFLGQWLHACDKLMEIEVLSPRKPPLFLTKQADSVYNDLSE